VLTLAPGLNSSIELPGPFDSTVAKYTWKNAQSAPGSQDFFGLHFVTTSGSASDDSTWLVTLAAGPTVTIARNGTNITDPTTNTQNVVVGERIDLVGAVTNLPSGVTVKSQSWTMSGTTTGRFLASQASGKIYPPDCDPQTNSSPTCTPSTQPATTFSWIAPSSNTPRPQTVIFAATLSDGSIAKGSATFNLVGPEMPSIATKTGQVLPPFFDGSMQIVLRFGTPFKSLADVGILFTGSAKRPAGNPGTFIWTQLITSEVVQSVRASNPPRRSICTTTNALDNQYPYADPNKLRLPEQVDDSPFMFLQGYARRERDFAARMFLLWDPTLPAGCTPSKSTGTQAPCDSIPVPLGYVDWRFIASAIRVSPTLPWLPGGFGGADAFQESLDFPQWNTYITNGPGPSPGTSCVVF